MDLFSSLVVNAAAIAEKSGLSVDQIEGIRTSLQSASNGGCDYNGAVKAAAAQNCVSIEKIAEILRHAGPLDGSPIDTEGLFGGLISRPPRD